MDWDRNKCILLIEQYKKYPELWTKSHTDHYNKVRKQEVWNNIAEALNCSSVEEVRKKMDSLLASYRRAKLKCRRTIENGNVRKSLKQLI